MWRLATALPVVRTTAPTVVDLAVGDRRRGAAARTPEPLHRVVRQGTRAPRASADTTAYAPYLRQRGIAQRHRLARGQGHLAAATPAAGSPSTRTRMCCPRRTSRRRTPSRVTTSATARCSFGCSRRTGALCACEDDGPRDAFAQLRTGFRRRRWDSNPRGARSRLPVFKCVHGVGTVSRRILNCGADQGVCGFRVPCPPPRSTRCHTVRLQFRLQPPGVGHDGQCSPRYGSG